MPSKQKKAVRQARKTKAAPAFSPATFTLVRAGEGPIYRRIRILIERWLEQQAEGARLPPERELAEQFGVERNTLRLALQPLVDEGVLIKRVGRGGGIVVGRQLETHRYHPFIQPERHPASVARTVRMVVFENWPVQKAVWTRLLQAFNEAHPATPAELVWLPVDVNNWERYRRYIREEHPDLVMLSLDLAREMIEADALAPLPDAFSRQLCGPEYQGGVLGKEAGLLLRHVVPVHLNFFGVLWNEDLVPAALRPPVPLLTPRKWMSWIGSLARGLPRSVCLCADASMLTALRGVPDRPLSEKDMAAFLRASLEEIASLRPWKDRLIWRDPSSFWSGGRFRSGETAFYAGNMGLVLPRMSGVSFRWNGVFAAAEPGMHQEPGLTLIGMAADAPQPGPSEEMLRFLASPAAQEEITRAGMSGAYLTAANRGLLAHLRAADPASLDAALRAQAIRGPETNALGNVLDYDLRDLYQDTLMGRRTAAEALPLALDTVRSRMGQQPPPPQK